MDQTAIFQLFALLRSAICGTPLQEQEKVSASPEMLSKLVAISKRHDISHLLAFACDINSIPISGAVDIKADIAKAVYRYEQINYELGRFCKALEQAQIAFMPLKGAVLRNYYPKPWMRTSCDIDVLVHEADAEQATDLLVADCGYTRAGKNSHDISLFSPNHVHIELHYQLVEDWFVNPSATTALSEIWSHAVKAAGFDYRYEMPDDFFYFYHIAHMAKHFENGGCGIRSFLDLWILDHIDGVNQANRDALLQQGGLLQFAGIARLLSKIWFGNGIHTVLTQYMEQFVLSGGVYGTSENRIAVQQQRKGGRFKYALSKIFIPYDVIKFHYPILKKHRWLTPIMEVRRWFKLAFCGHAKRTLRELHYNNNMSHTEADNMQAFLQNIGL